MLVLLNKLKNLLRYARITGSADNTKQFPVQQINYKGKVANSFIGLPYGIYANVENDYLGIMCAIDGAEDNRVLIPLTADKRPRDLEQNELAVYHPDTESFIKFKNNGNIEIDCVGQQQGKIIINCVQATLTASTSVLVDSPQTTFTGDVQVNGSTTLSGNVTSNGKDISDTHTHNGSPTAPSGPISPTGGPV